MIRKSYVFALLSSLVLLASACDKNDNVVLLFSVEDDKKLGLQVSQQIASDPSYKIVSRTQYAQAYQYLDQIVDDILNSGEVVYKDDFVWEVYLLEDDNTLNAFATPGGYIYVYTGLIKYLENVDALAGVLGHEIAHADLRHSSRTMQKEYGVSVLLGILLGNNENQLIQIAGQMAGQLSGLSFSREYETESDLRSVEYLAQTSYACDGAKIFFQKLENSGQGGTTPQFLSTHPSPVNRIQNIEDKAVEENCDTQLMANSGYAAFQGMLP